jgi:hypothetical protein
LNAVLPFLPFSKGEQSVIVHKYILEFSRKIQKAINLSIGPKEQLIGNARLLVRRDASLCRILADAEYHPVLGARSLISAVSSVEDMLVELYLSVDEEIVETEGFTEFVIDVVAGEIVARMATAEDRKESS